MTSLVKPQPGLDAIKPYIPGKPISEVQREYGLRDVVKMASNENPTGPSPKAMLAAQEALCRVNLYPDGQSYYLRQALADKLKLDPAQVVVGNGADGIIMQTCLAYLDGGDQVIVSRSSFPIYDIYTHVMRATLIKTPLREYRLDLDAMARAITDKTKMVFICNPNNPTGTMVTSVEVDAFMRRVPDHVLVVMDEAYYEFVDSDEFPDTLRYLREGRKNMLIMRTFSKIYGLAGIRLGYGIAQPEVLAPLNKIKEPFAVNLLAQEAGVAALSDEGFLRETLSANREGRLFLYREFKRLGLFCVESHTNFVLVKIGPQARQVIQSLLEEGIIVRPCDGYDLPELLRITVGSPAQNARLITALERVLSFSEIKAPKI
jgi:histidinol-phosphate aminotransferase